MTERWVTQALKAFEKANIFTGSMPGSVPSVTPFCTARSREIGFSAMEATHP